MPTIAELDLELVLAPRLGVGEGEFGRTLGDRLVELVTVERRLGARASVIANAVRFLLRALEPRGVCPGIGW